MIRTLSIAFILSAAVGCATTQDEGPTTPGADELAGENGQDGESPKADGHDNFNFLAVHKNGAFDCHNIVGCQQYELQRVNRSTTQCWGGTTAPKCGVARVEWSAMKLPQETANKLEAAIQREAADPSIGTQVLVRGSFKSHVEFTTFEPTEVWLAQKSGGSDAGTFVRIFNRGIRCITAPCPQFEEGRLNSTRTMNIDGLDWGIRPHNSLEDAFEDSVFEATTTADGVIIAGERTTRSAVSYVENLRTVGQVYFPVK